jgi:hypothetical protein
MKLGHPRMDYGRTVWVQGLKSRHQDTLSKMHVKADSAFPVQRPMLSTIEMVD